MSKEAHKHAYTIPYTEKVRLSKHEIIEGQPTSETSGTDVIKGYKCSCGLKQAVDLERSKL